MYQPQYTITDTLLARISEAERLRTKMQTTPVQVAWLERIRLESLVRRAHFSTAIEGNPLTLPEVEALASAKQVEVTDRAKREVLNYLAALRWIARQPENTPVTETAVLRLHRIIMTGLLEPRLVGAYKVSANVIMSAGQVVYRPPGPQAATPGTRALVAWLEGPGQSTHPIVASACAHYEIARLHPFRDGNGRVARALATWVLYHRGFDTQHLFAVDQYFKEDHEGYYQALQRVHKKEDGDLTSWLEYVALAVLETLSRTYQRIEQLALPPSTRKLSLTRQQERLLVELQGKRGMTVEELQRLLGVERVQVYRVLRPLVRKRVLEKSTTRPVVYRLAPRA
ncbi:MAG: Fic family protein [Candidatus Omnitrophota bacterium]|nr:Fic family protein [Candidatus Omnitrophota bacterium]